jgi:hypothetical protein
MKKKQRVKRKKNREWICLYREAEDEIHALLHYCFFFFFNCLHYYFSLYICSLGRYYTENMLSFTLNIMLTDSLLLTNITNRMLTILIANLLTLGIIRTVDIFTLYMPPQSQAWRSQAWDWNNDAETKKWKDLW